MTTAGITYWMNIDEMSTLPKIICRATERSGDVVAAKPEG